MIDADKDYALEAVSKIFNVMVWNKTVPFCYFQWIRKNFLDNVWQLRVKQFKPFICKSKIESNGVVDVEYFKCGCSRAVKGDGTWHFKGKWMHSGDHENLHKIIHCLHEVGVESGNIVIEERFRDIKPDVLGKIGQDFIVVELGKLSALDKFSLVDDDIVKEFWFGDTDGFIYALSRKAPKDKHLFRKEDNNYFRHFIDYYQANCKGEGHSSCISSPYSAWNCLEIRRVAKELSMVLASDSKT